MKIQQNLTKCNFTAKSGRSIEYIVIHYTGNSGDTAHNNTKYFKSRNLGSSAHYFVDSKSIWQCVKDKDVAWHCGAKTYTHPLCRNANSIGVELCDGKETFDEATLNNAAELIHELMARYNVPLENVIRHYDVTGKLCPAPFIEQTAWDSFKGRLKGEDINMNELESFKKEYAAYVEHTNTIINTMGKEIQSLKDIINVMGKEIVELRLKKG